MKSIALLMGLCFSIAIYGITQKNNRSIEDRQHLVFNAMVINHESGNGYYFHKNKKPASTDRAAKQRKSARPSKGYALLTATSGFT